MTGKTPNPKKQVSFTNDNVLESIRGVGSQVGKTVSHDVVGKIGSDVISALLGSLPTGELKANQSVELPLKKEKHAQVAPRPEFFRPQPVRVEDIALKQQIEAVRAELKALVSSLKNFQQEVQTAISQAPVEPGVYHLNFFARLRTVINVLRQQVEDSRTWLSLCNSRKKKMGYWGLYKKHGTSFGLSSERSIATAAG